MYHQDETDRIYDILGGIKIAYKI